MYKKQGEISIIQTRADTSIVVPPTGLRIALTEGPGVSVTVWL